MDVRDTFAGEAGADGRAWLADYRDRLDALRDRAERAQQEIGAINATVRSKDGAVSASVDGSGALSGLVLAPATERMPRDRLAELVVGTVAQARAEAARRAGEALAPLLERQR